MAGGIAPLLVVVSLSLNVCASEFETSVRSFLLLSFHILGRRPVSGTSARYLACVLILL